MLPIKDAPPEAICADCPLPLDTYDQYAERPSGMVGEFFVVDVLCLGCAVAA